MDTSSRCPPTPFRPRPSSNPSRCRDLWQAVKEEKGERARGVLREREREERRRERRGKNKEGRFASDRERETCRQPRFVSAANSLRSFLPSFPPLVFLFWSEKVRERRGEGVRVTACRQRLLLPLSLPPSLPHCPFLPFWDEDGIGWGTNVIHSPARGRRSRSLRPNGQLCKSPMPPPEEVYIHLCRHRHGRFVFFFVFFTASTFLGDLRVREREVASPFRQFGQISICSDSASEAHSFPLREGAGKAVTTVPPWEFNKSAALDVSLACFLLSLTQTHTLSFLHSSPSSVLGRSSLLN